MKPEYTLNVSSADDIHADGWKDWEGPPEEVMASAWSFAGESTVLTQTLPVTADYISRVSSTAATKLKALCVIVGIGHSSGDLATGT